MGAKNSNIFQVFRCLCWLTGGKEEWRGRHFSHNEHGRKAKLLSSGNRRTNAWNGCVTTSFMRHQVCRGCSHTKGWLLPPQAPEPSCPARLISDLIVNVSSTAAPGSVRRTGGTTATAAVPARPELTNPASEIQQSEELVKLLQAQGLDASEATAKLAKLRATTADLCPTSQIFVETSAAHRRAPNKRETAEAAVVAW